jgi:hypothetical protein
LPTIIDNLQRVKMLCGEPSKPEPHIIFEHLENQISHHLAQLQNSSANWSVASIVIQGSSAVEDYLVPAQDFGKPFWVYWDNPEQIQYPRVEIPFTQLNNADQFYSGPRAITPNSGGIVPTTNSISFYRTAGNWFFRLTPVPGNSFPITIWYETVPQAPTNLQDTPGLSPFHHLIRVQTALSVLPHCEWDDVKPDAKEARLVSAWDRKQERLSGSLGRDEIKFQAQFSTYIGTLQQAGIEQREPFGAGCEDDIGGTWGGFGPNQWLGG